MTVTAVAYAASRQIMFDQNAAPVVGGLLYVNQAGTTALATSYTDATLTAANPNPLTTDGFGRIPPIYFGAGTYKVVAQNAAGAQLWIDDDLPGGIDYAAMAATAAQAALGTSGQLQTGDYVGAHGPAPKPGFVIANGLTIGNTGSQATARANADTQALFVFLWNNDPTLAVLNGRGVTATADFEAGKTIALPDLRGRALIGCDQMSSVALSGRITAASTATPDQVGSSFGAETQTLAVAQLPAITPTITVDGGVATPGLHTHAATTGNAGGHNHTLTDNGHSHTTGVQTDNSHYATPNNGGSTCLGQVYPPSVTDQTAKTGITIAGVLDHNHSVTIDNGTSGGSHTHSAACSSFGGGQAHGNAQPSLLITWHIRL